MHFSGEVFGLKTFLVNDLSVVDGSLGMLFNNGIEELYRVGFFDENFGRKVDNFRC